MIFLVQVKLDKFYCIEVMNLLKVICYEFFSLRIFVHIKLSYYLFKRQDLLEKIIERYHNGGDKKEAAAYYIAKKEF